MQKSLFEHYKIENKKMPLTFGGNTAQQKGRRKIKRPFISQAPLHVTLKSTQARGKSSMLNLPFQAKIRSFIYNQAKKNFISIERFENMGNHAHLLIRCKLQQQYNKFIRAITGFIALLIKKVAGAQNSGSFWDNRPHTRILTTRAEFEYLLQVYLPANQIEREYGKIARLNFIEQARSDFRRYRCRTSG